MLTHVHDLHQQWAAERQGSHCWPALSTAVKDCATIEEIQVFRRELRGEAIRRIDVALFGHETYEAQTMWAGESTFPVTLEGIGELRIGVPKAAHYTTPRDYSAKMLSVLEQHSLAIERLEKILFPFCELEDAPRTLAAISLHQATEPIRQWEQFHNLPAMPFFSRVAPEYLPQGYHLILDTSQKPELPFDLLFPYQVPNIESNAFRELFEAMGTAETDWANAARPAAIEKLIRTYRPTSGTL